MHIYPVGPGLGRMWDPDWLADQTIDDPDGILHW